MRSAELAVIISYPTRASGIIELLKTPPNYRKLKKLNKNAPKNHADVQAYRRVIPFYLSYDKPCGKLALGQNCIKIISDKSNSVATFLRIQTDIYIEKYIVGSESDSPVQQQERIKGERINPAHRIDFERFSIERNKTKTKLSLKLIT